MIGLGLLLCQAKSLMHAAPVEPHHFRRACSKFATGVTIVTALDPQGAPHGMTVNSFTSVSLSPPLVLVCIDRQTAMLDYFAVGKHFAINVLHEEHKDLSTAFSRRGCDRFEGVEWRGGETGVPLLPDMLA